jgi:hypothetical protein
VVHAFPKAGCWLDPTAPALGEILTVPIGFVGCEYSDCFSTINQFELFRFENLSELFWKMCQEKYRNK